MTELRATYRLQLGGDFGFAAARELVPYLADLGVSHVYLPPSFQARDGSTHGYDVVDPTSISNELGGEEEFFALVDAAQRRRAWGSCSTSSRTTWRPTREPVLGRPGSCARSSSTSTRRPAATGASSTSTTSRRSARRTRRCSRRRTSWRCGWCARGTSTGCGSTIRTGSPTPPATCGGCARAASSTSGWRRSSTPASRCATGRSRARSATSSSTTSAALFVDPAGEAPLTDLWVEVSGDDRRFGELAFEAKLEQARTTFAPEVERLLREAPERVAGLERALASLPVYRTYVEPWSGRVEDEDRAGRGRGRAAGLAGLQAAARGAGLGGVRHALPADDAAGDGQGRRGHGVLPLRAAAGPQRRRRRPGRGSACRCATSTAATRSGRRASRATCWSPRRTTPSARATCGRGSARWPRCRTSSRRTCRTGSPSAAR